MSKQTSIKKRKTYDLRLTKYELLHLRDLFSVILPSESKKTMSQSLAELENRALIESLLWNKISAACEAADIPLNEAAPDYVVAPTSPPPMTVFQLASEPATEEQESKGFIKSTGE
jgi:hypothetical protein